MLAVSKMISKFIQVAAPLSYSVHEHEDYFSALCRNISFFFSYLITSQHTDKDIHVFLSECRSGVPLFCIVPHTQSKYAWMRHVCIVSQNLHFVEASLLESVCLFSSSVRVRSRSSNDSITLNEFNILGCFGMRFLRRGFED